MPSEEEQWRNHYNRTARSYDRKEWLWGVLLGYSDRVEHGKLVERLHLQPGQRILEVSVGTGASLTLAAERLGLGATLVGVDIAVEMLKACRAKLARAGTSAGLVTAEAGRLPFVDGAFDAVLHFGAMSMFSDPKAAIAEMVRVAKGGARLVIGDVGVRPARRNSLRHRLVVRANPRYATEPPAGLLGPQAGDPRVSWIRNDTCYVIEFVKR